MTTGASVFLLHYPTAQPFGRHYLGVADGVMTEAPAEVAHGAGVLPCPAGAELADVWETGDLAAAEALRARLARQGGRRRLCSICSPGNGRGTGERGKYDRSAMRKGRSGRVPGNNGRKG